MLFRSGKADSRTVSLTDRVGSGAITAAVTDQLGAVTYGASVSGSNVIVTMTVAKGAAEGRSQGVLRIYRGGAEIAHATVYTLVK